MKALICMDLTTESLALFKERLPKYNFEQYSEVHLIHGFQTQSYSDNFIYSTFPTEDQYPEVEKAVIETLRNFQNESPALENLNVKFACLISSNPKEAISQFAREHEFDQIIIGTRGKHGLEAMFSSSFAEYMVRHAKADLIILRSHK
ncbi:MAG: universal stress protein [Bacteriovoracaceae bacterium]